MLDTFLPWPREKSFSWAILTLVPRSLLLAKPHGNACSAGYRIGYKSIKSRIVVRVVTWHYVSTNNKLICPEPFTDNIGRKYFSQILQLGVKRILRSTSQRALNVLDISHWLL